MEICPLGEYFYQKFEIFAIISSYLSPYFYADNVKILLKRTDGLRNPSTKQIFVKIAQVAVQYFIAPRMWCILISISPFVYHGLELRSLW